MSGLKEFFWSEEPAPRSAAVSSRAPRHTIRARFWKWMDDSTKSVIKSLFVDGLALAVLLGAASVIIRHRGLQKIPQQEQQALNSFIKNHKIQGAGTDLPPVNVTEEQFHAIEAQVTKLVQLDARMAKQFLELKQMPSSGAVRPSQRHARHKKKSQPSEHLRVK